MPVIVLLAVSSVAGQWLERTIWLPDSFPGLYGANCVFRNPVTDRLYFSGFESDCIQIYDVASHSKYGFIKRGGVYQFQHCPESHSIWASSWGQEQMLVIDDRADTLVAELGFVIEPMAIEYEAARGKVYCADIQDELVVVFDAASAAVLDSIEVGFEEARMAWDSVHDVIYCAGWAADGESLAVIDCSADTVAGRIPGTRWTSDVLLHPDGERLYCISSEPHNVVRIVGTDTRAVVDSVMIPTSVGWREHGRLVLNPVSNVLYCLGMDYDLYDGRRDGVADTVAVIDCTADILLGLVDLGLGGDVSAIAVNEQDNKVYVVEWDQEEVLVLGVPDSVTARVELGNDAAGVGWCPTDNQVYLTLESDSVLVMDGVTDSIVERIGYDVERVSDLYWVSGGNKLYVWQGDSLRVLESGDSVARRVSPAGEFVAYWAELNRLYFRPAGSHEGLVVFDCNRDTVVASIEGVRGSGPVVSELHRLFLSEDDTTFVCDLLLDSVAGTAVGWGDLVYNPRNGLLYGAIRQQQDINVIDPRTDSVVATVPDNRVESMVVNTTDNEVYFIRDHDQSLVLVLNGLTHTVDDTIELAGEARVLAWIPEMNKLYGVGAHNIEVADCRTRQALGTIELNHLADDAWFINERTGRFWINAGNDLAVVDYRADTVVTTLGVNGFHLALGRIDDRVYSAIGKRLAVVRDGVPGVVENKDEGGRMEAEPEFPSILRGPDLARLDCRVIDALGRDVTDERGRLAPGVYFLKDEGGRLKDEPGGRATVRKVIVQR